MKTSHTAVKSCSRPSEQARDYGVSYVRASDVFPPSSRLGLGRLIRNVSRLAELLRMQRQTRRLRFSYTSLPWSACAILGRVDAKRQLRISKSTPKRS